MHGQYKNIPTASRHTKERNISGTLGHQCLRGSVSYCLCYFSKKLIYRIFVIIIMYLVEMESFLVRQLSRHLRRNGTEENTICKTSSNRVRNAKTKNKTTKQMTKTKQPLVLVDREHAQPQFYLAIETERRMNKQKTTLFIATFCSLAGRDLVD